MFVSCQSSVSCSFATSFYITRLMWQNICLTKENRRFSHDDTFTLQLYRKRNLIQSHTSWEGKPAETHGHKCSLRGRRCEQMREIRMLPNLSAADVACWAELSFSGILGRSGGLDLQQAERCGREDWQEMVYSESLLCYDWVTGQWGVWEGCIFKRFRRTGACCVLTSSRWELSNWIGFFFCYLSMRARCGRNEESNFAYPSHTFTASSVAVWWL